MTRDKLTIGAMGVLLVLSSIWGINMVAIKISNQGLAPVTAAAFRSTAASGIIIIWMYFRKIRLFHRGAPLVWGVCAGALFGLEFLLLYAGLNYTSASRGIVLLYTSPFFVALGAHFYLPDDRLTLMKSTGLFLAFFGIAAVMIQHTIVFDPVTLKGDLLALGGGVAWGLTTLVIKKHLAGEIEPIQTLHYQLFFSALMLWPAARILEPSPVRDFGAITIISLFYQSVIVAAASYLAWFVLVHRFSVSRLSAFAFFAPVVGVVAGGVLLGEPLPATLLIGLLGVAGGIYLVNR